MKLARIDSGVIQLLSTIAQQDLTPEDSTPTVLFLAALVTLLFGVIDADGKATEEEQRRLSEVLDLFISPKGNLRQLAEKMLQVVKKQHIHYQIGNLQTLTAPLDEAERVLLISFGYDMSAVDKNVDIREKRYLKAVAHQIGIKPHYVEVLEAGFSKQESINTTTLEEVRSLLAPVRFSQLDPVFVNAAKEMLTVLPVTHQLFDSQSGKFSNYYEELQAFQKERQQLINLCDRIFYIAREGRKRKLLPQKFQEEIGEFSQKLRSRQFRVAVVGEFSQGKSTLLNALLQEKFLPVRAIPCTGILTVLKHGSQKRVTCVYRDGHSEEIPFEQYQEKVTISKEAATGDRRDELLNSEIQEIIVEHPDLSLCHSGVEIVDSPGLNEHPAYAAITNQLIANSDAVIFVTSAHRSLTDFEYSLLQDIKAQLNRLNVIDENQSAPNLFIVVNFMDLLKTEEDLLDVQKRIKTHVLREHPIVKSEDRIHFISAEKTIESILLGIENEYSVNFKKFTQAIERFLIFERSFLELQKITAWLEKQIQKILNELHQVEDFIGGKLAIAQRERQQLLGQVTEATKSAHSIHAMVKPLCKQSFEEASQSWLKWRKEVKERIEEKSEQWNVRYSRLWNKDKLADYYFNQFLQELKKEIDKWEKEELTETILSPKLNELDISIDRALASLQQNLSFLDRQINTSFSEQLNLEIEGINIAMTIPGNLMKRLGTGAGIVSGGVLISSELIPQIISLGFSSRTIISAITFGVGPILVGVVAGMLADVVLGSLHAQLIKKETKKKVIDLGFQMFDEHSDQYIARLQEFIGLSFKKRSQLAEAVIEQFTSSADNLLKLYAPKMLKQPQSERDWITQKYPELKKLQQEVQKYREFYISSEQNQLQI